MKLVEMLYRRLLSIRDSFGPVFLQAATPILSEKLQSICHSKLDQMMELTNM